jgi:hypothetical protein
MLQKSRIVISRETLLRVCKNFKLSPELQKMIEDNRRAVVDAAMSLLREKRK